MKNKNAELSLVDRNAEKTRKGTNYLRDTHIGTTLDAALADPLLLGFNPDVYVRNALMFDLGRLRLVNEDSPRRERELTDREMQLIRRVARSGGRSVAHDAAPTLIRPTDDAREAVNRIPVFVDLRHGNLRAYFQALQIYVKELPAGARVRDIDKIMLRGFDAALAA